MDFPDYLTKPRSKVLIAEIMNFWHKLGYYDVTARSEIGTSREGRPEDAGKVVRTLHGVRSNLIDGLPHGAKRTDARQILIEANRGLAEWKAKRKVVWADPRTLPL